MPIPLQGSCAVEYDGKILLLGGKNENVSGEVDISSFAKGLVRMVGPNAFFLIILFESNQLKSNVG